MDGDVILTVDRESDTVTLEGNIRYPALVSIGLMRNKQFYLKVEFVDMDENKDAVILALWKEDRAIGFSSEIIEREDYKITQVVITNISSESQYGKFWAIWECISDEPGRSLIIT